MAKSRTLQTVIVSKSRTNDRDKAREIARKHADRIYTSRETSESFRFRQRPPDQFDQKSFRTFKVPGEKGVSLVYGQLKNKYVKNPSLPAEQRFYNFIRRKIEQAKDAIDISDIAKRLQEYKFKSITLKDNASKYLADRVDLLRKRGVKLPKLRGRGAQAYEKYIGELAKNHPQQRMFNPKMTDRKPDSVAWQRGFEGNPKSNPATYKLRNPKRVPDPGPSAWCGTVLEWKWRNGKDEHIWASPPRGKKWLFLWVPRYKAVLAIPAPKMKRGELTRRGGAAKSFERFMSRKADSSYEINVPKCKLVKLGPAQHIVYRSNKWLNPADKKRPTSGKNIDYIHDFKNGVKLYCGPTKENPEVFLCFGGKLTLTERGLVF